MTEPRRAPRRVLTWILVVVLALLAAVAAYWALARSGAAPAPPPVTVGETPLPTPTLSSPAVSTESSTPAGVGQVRTANGCLGGTDPYQAVLAAQQGATPDQVGAAEFALTFARWTVTYPIDPNAAAVLGQVAAPGYQPLALQGMNQYAATLSQAGYTAAGTTPGAANQYRITSSEQSQTSVILDLIVYRQSTTASGETDTVRGYTTLLLDLVDGHWQITGSLPAIGSDPFAPRSDAPWVPFVGTC